MFRSRLRRIGLAAAAQLRIPAQQTVLFERAGLITDGFSCIAEVGGTELSSRARVALH